MDIRLFDANLADKGDLDDYYRLVVAGAPDWSTGPPVDYAAAIGQARKAESVFGPMTKWAAHVDGTLAGFAQVSLPEDNSTHLAVPRITVHPHFRRRGVGTGLLRHVATECRALDRSTMEAWNVPADRVGERWAVRRGFVRVNAMVEQVLAMPDVDPVTWRVDAPAGYHAVRWIGAAPRELVASYARASDAIHDAPFGEANFEFPQWTVELLRKEEARVAASGAAQWVVAAVRDADNTVAGFTELQLRPWEPTTAVVNNTAVVEAHRGHGLGLFVKARMSAWLRADRPEIDSIVTSTATTNEHMLRVNQRIGFHIVETKVVLNAELDELRLDPGSAGRQSAQQNLQK